MSVTKYLHLAKIDVKEKAKYIWDQLSFIVILAIILFIFLQLWTAIYGEKKIIEGFTIAEMIWYLMIAETIVFAGGTDRIEEIGDEVRSGIIANFLLKPINYVKKELAIGIGNFFYKLVLIGILGGGIAFFFVGAIEVSLITWPLVLLTIIGSIILNLLMVTGIGLLAFWLEDSSSLYFIYQKALFILGGMLVPLEIYPIWFQKWIAFLPPAFIIYGPAKLSVKFSMEQFMNVILGQIGWIIIAGIITFTIYHKGLRAVNVHGG